MNAREPTWFVRLQGLTLGPLSTDELRKSVREGEISPEDKLNRGGEHTWRRLADYPELLAFWESLRRPVFVPHLPSPQFLWKKSRTPAPTIAAGPTVAEAVAAPAEIPAVVPAAPELQQELAAKPPAKVKMKVAAKAKKPAKKALPKKNAKKEKVAATKLEPAPVVVEAAAEKPIEIERPVPQSEPVPPSTSKTVALDSLAELLDPASLKINPEILFPVRPDVPAIEANVQPIRAPFGRRAEAAPRSTDKRRLALRIAALIGLVLVVAGVAYWAGQKTRDLKELPLPDPSSPTTQLPAASDPIQPLRAPTRPQRD